MNNRQVGITDQHWLEVVCDVLGWLSSAIPLLSIYLHTGLCFTRYRDWRLGLKPGGVLMVKNCEHFYGREISIFHHYKPTFWPILIVPLNPLALTPRFIAVHYVFNHRELLSHRNMALLCCVSWLVPVLCATMPFFGLGESKTTDSQSEASILAIWPLTANQRPVF